MPLPKGPISAPQNSYLPSPKTQKLMLSLLLVLATLALYNAVVRAPFLNLDDDIYVVQNPEVRSGLNWHSAAWAFRTSYASNWHPLTWLSLELDCQLFGLNPAGPHIVNLLLHAANAVLVFLLLSISTKKTWRSLMVAALFALHPINVESVAWISERKNVLSMLFFLMALAAYGWYAKTKQPGAGNSARLPYATVTVLYALALMAKPQVITFPFALLLLDYWPLQRTGSKTTKKLVLEKIPWFVLSAASALITMKVQAAALREEVPPWEHLTNAALAYAKYVGKAFWPANLAPLYPHPGGSISIPAAVLSALGIIAISILVVKFRQHRYLPVGWFWFLGIMVPMVGLVQVGIQSMADRYAYIPLLGIFVIICWGIPDLLQSQQAPNSDVDPNTNAETTPASSLSPAPARQAASLPLLVMSVLVLAALAFALHRQVNFWTDNFTLWRHTLDITRRNFLAEDSAANALLVKGKTDEAMQYFRRAQAIRPTDPVSKLNIASYEQHQGKFLEAIQGYGPVLELTTDAGLLTLAHANRAYAEYALKEYDSAQKDFEAALKLQPDDAAAYLGLGMIAQQRGDWTTAARHFENAVKIQPTPTAYELLAQVLESAGRKEDAAAARAQAAKMFPSTQPSLTP